MLKNVSTSTDVAVILCDKSSDENPAALSVVREKSRFPSRHKVRAKRFLTGVCAEHCVSGLKFVGVLVSAEMHSDVGCTTKQTH